MKPIATVQLPIGKFQVIVSDHENNEELGKWVRKFARALSLADPDLEPFAAELLQDVENYRERERLKKQEAKARREQHSLSQNVELANNLIGGRPTNESKAQAANVISFGKSGPMPTEYRAVMDFALDNNLDEAFVRECWEATRERGWRDADGRPIKDWKGFVFKWVGTRVENFGKQGEA